MGRGENGVESVAKEGRGFEWSRPEFVAAGFGIRTASKRPKRRGRGEQANQQRKENEMH